MGNVHRAKMSLGNRAKQFMPFSALGGLERALQKKEQEVQNRFFYAPPEKTQLKEVLHALKTGDTVCVTGFTENATVRWTATVERIDFGAEILFLEGLELPFSEIVSIEHGR